MTLKRFGVLALVLAGLVGGSWMGLTAQDSAPDGAIGAPEALAQAQSGAITIIDVRRASEWRETGLPETAEGISLHNEDFEVRGDFIADIEAVVGGDKNAPIALICASGVRSSRARDLLAEAGFTQILDINEGMLGNGRDPGWLARSLPVSACKSC